MKDGFKVYITFIVNIDIKRDLKSLMYDAPNVVEELRQMREYLTVEKAEAIKDDLVYFELII